MERRKDLSLEKQDLPSTGLLEDGEYSSPIEGKRSLGSLKVPLKGHENIKLLATLDILNPRPQEGLNKIFSSKFKQPKLF
ncbi:hypothetical protein M9H77_36465 [Catharanthus roseus]|uniref:Uncharacterized protein n=1 Tax=Catharanthus roseus TaxID=4058 RepID=A0ACB9ZSQ8_CATRO|nr:hypothetical protein M9H77_36465 [Catharanthus roseus]